MSAFESTLQTLLAHTETLGLSEGDYLQVCNAMKDAFQKKPEEKKILQGYVNKTPRVIKMKGYTFECLESVTVVYEGSTPNDRQFKSKLTNPKGVVTESIIKGEWADYIQKMIRFLRPTHIEQIYDGLSEHTTFKEWMEEANKQDVTALELESGYRVHPAYEPTDMDDDNIWRGDYTYGRFVDQYRVM